MDAFNVDAGMARIHGGMHFRHETVAEEVGRLVAQWVAHRSLPQGPVDLKGNADHGGRIVYWSEPDSHVWEALTASYARRRPDAAA